VTRESEPISGPPREAEAGETEGFAGDEAGRGRGRRRRRRRGRGRGRDEAAMPFGAAAQADLAQGGMTGEAESDAAIATSQSSPPSQTPSDAGAQDRDSSEQAPSAASPDAVPADLEAGPRAAPDGSDDDTGRRRRRGRRGGRGRRGDDQANGAATRAPLPSNPPTETPAPAAASGEDDLLARARALYAPADRFAPPPAASVVAEGHEWPWNRREEQPAPPPMAIPAPEPVAEAEPATGPIATETPAPTADIVVPGAPTAATDRAVQEVPAAIAPPTPPTPEPPAVGPLEAPASAATEPAPAAEPAAPAGPPRRGWWRRSPT